MEALFLKVLNMSITATWAFAFVFALRLILRSAPKWISYALWSVVLFRLVCPVSFESALSVFGRIGVAPRTVSGTMEYIPVSTGGVAVQPASDGVSVQNVLSQGVSSAASGSLETLIFLGACLWLAGIAALLVYSAAAHVRLRRRVATATLASEGVFETDEIASPFVFGFFRPKIYLPVGLGEAEETFVLLHERAHIRRRDHLVKPIAFFALLIHWFNPFMWLAFLLMSRDMEMSCDESVVRGLDRVEKAGYGETLAHLATRRPLPAGNPLAFGESGARSRVKNVLHYKKPAFWVVTVAVLAAVILGICLLANPASGAGEDGGTVEVRFETAGDIPDLVKEYAAEYVQNDIAYYNSMDGQTIIDAKITGLTQLDTGTASLTVDVQMWLLEYRLLPQDPDNVILTGGMTMADGWRTEYGSVGQPLLVVVRDISSETWQRVGRTHTGAVGEDYGGDYTAATMALYHSYLEVEAAATEATALEDAIVGFMGDGWWYAGEQKTSDYKAGAFVTLQEDGTDGSLVFYGVSLYRSYTVFEENFAVTEDFLTPCVIMLDAETLSCTDFWVPGDGAYFEMDLYEKFPADIAEEAALHSYDYYDQLAASCDKQARSYGGLTAPDS